MTREQACETVRAAMTERGVSFAQLAAALDRPLVWVAAAVFGQHPLSGEDAGRLAAELGIAPDVAAVLEQIPTRGALDAAVPVDPTMYRMYEIIQVYAPALKALINEEFGDGIMSAINFKVDFERVPDPAGDRVRITLDGKFLPYQWG